MLLNLMVLKKEVMQEELLDEEDDEESIKHNSLEMDRPASPKLPKHVSKDDEKQLMAPSKIMQSMPFA
jgi:hypothetical protein